MRRGGELISSQDGGRRRLSAPQNGRRTLMNEAKLDQLLGGVRRKLHAATPTAVPPYPGCLPFERARALALDPERWREEEQAHAMGCRRCARLVRSFERE